MNAEPQSLCRQLSINISISYYFHMVIVYLVFVTLIQIDLIEENSAVTNNHIRENVLHNSCKYLKVYKNATLMTSNTTKYTLQSLRRVTRFKLELS